LYLSESSSDGEFPTNKDDKYMNEEDLRDVRIDFVNEIENDDSCFDQADDCYSENEYHSPKSIDDDSADNDNIIDDIETMQGSAWEINYVNPEIKIGKRLKNVADLRFCLQQYSVRKNFNFKFKKNDLKRVIVKCTEKRCT